MRLAWELAGAIAILVPFALFQAGRISRHAVAYLAANLLGATVLTAVALVERQWGFVLIQAVWALAAARGLLRRRDPA